MKRPEDRPMRSISEYAQILKGGVQINEIH